MLCFSIVLWLRWLRKSAPKNGSCGGSAAQDVAKICTTPARKSDLEVKIVKNWRARGTFGSWSCQKFAPRLRATAIWKSKSLNADSLGALLEAEVAKICTTPSRDGDSEVKIVKAPGDRDVFWGSKCVLRGRRRDFGTASSLKSLKRIAILSSTCHISGKSRRTASVSQLVS